METMTNSQKKHEHRFIVAAGSSGRNILSLSLLLKRFNYEVFIANTAVQALERISRDRPALVFTDLVLTDMGGMDFLEKLRENKGAKFIPVIFMISPGDAAAEHRCMSYGAAGCITKPVQAEELYWTVQHVIEPRPRSSMRIGTHMPVSVDNRSLDCGTRECSIDLSEQGMRLPIDKPYPRNKQVVVQLHMKERTISVEGSVRYYIPAPGQSDSPVMGLMFSSIAPQDKEFIRNFVRDEVVRDVNEALTSQYP
jgi:two-component system chemotaxis response regulator CheY